MTAALLQVRGLSRRFDGVQALADVAFDVGVGERVALIGPNGAGKSTCFACVAGQLPPDEGRIDLDGQSLLGLSPAQRLRAGLGRTFQVAQTFEALTVRENVQLALRAASGGLVVWDRLSRHRLDRAGELLASVELEEQAAVQASVLPYGARKRLELAMVLASEPRLLLLDEPAAGLSQAERQQLMALIVGLGPKGVAVLYTEHNMDAVFGVAQRVLVLVEGRLLADGPAAEVAANAEVQARYLGTPAGVQP